MGMTHTAAPWSIHKLSESPSSTGQCGDPAWDYRNIYIGSGEKILAEVVMWTAPDGGYPRVDTVEEQDANAALISAAPDLHDACRQAIAWRGLDGDGISDPVRQILLAALAKAERASVAARRGRYEG